MDRIEITRAAIEDAGGQTAVARACGVSQPSVFKWVKRGLPRTEWTGETDYSSVIERLTGGRYTRSMLLGHTVASETA